MKKKTVLTIFLSLLLSIYAVVPAFAITWIKEGKSWKCYNDSGSAVSGWIEDDSKWYYMDASGTMKTGWIKDDGNWYFLYDDGVMASDTWIDNYYVNTSGRWTKTR